MSNLEKTLKSQETKEFIGKEPDEPKLESAYDHAKGTKDISVRPKAHALPPQPVQTHAQKELPYFFPTLIWPDGRLQSRHVFCTTNAATRISSTSH